MAKKTPDEPNVSRAEVKREIKEYAQILVGVAPAAQPVLPPLTREQAMEYIKLLHEERRSARFLLVFAVCFLGLLALGLCWLALAYGHPELVTDLAKVLAGLAVGFASGYGVRAAARPRRVVRNLER